MALTSPPTTPAAPGSAPSRLVRSTFATLADAAWTWLFGSFYGFMADFRSWYAASAKPELEALEAQCLGAVATLTNVVWVSGTTYVIGDARYSPLNFATYRRKTAGAGTTDPSLDSTNWGLVYVPGTMGESTTASSAVDISLLFNSNRVQVVSMTAAGKSVNLPNATLISKGGPLYVVRNEGAFSFAVRDFAGNLLAVMEPATIAAFYCTNITTSAGVWKVGNQSYSGQTLSNFLMGTASVLNAVASTFTSICALSSTVILASYAQAGTSYFVVLTVSGNTISAGTPVNSTVSLSGVCSLVALDITRALFVYSTATALASFVVSVSGTVPSFAAAVTVAVPGGSSNVSACFLDTDKVIAAFKETTSTFLNTVVISVSGTTPSYGTKLVTNAAAVGTGTAIAALTPTAAIVAAALTTTTIGYPLAISGTTITVGTSATLQSGGNAEYPALARMADDTVLAVTHDTTNGFFAGLATLSGTVLSTVAGAGANSILIPGSGASTFQYPCQLIPLLPLNSGKFVVMWRRFGGGARVISMKASNPPAGPGTVEFGKLTYVQGDGSASAIYPACVVARESALVGLYQNASTFAEARVMEIAA